MQTFTYLAVLEHHRRKEASGHLQRSLLYGVSVLMLGEFFLFIFFAHDVSCANGCGVEQPLENIYGKCTEKIYEWETFQSWCQFHFAVM